MKSIELKSVPASVDESSSGSDLKVWDSICPSVAPNYMSYEYDFEWPCTTNRVPQTIQIENSSQSILLSSNDENAWQAPGPELLYIQTILQILLTQSYPLVLTNAPSMSIKLYHRLRTATKSQRFSVCSACTQYFDVVHAFSGRPLLTFYLRAAPCLSHDPYHHPQQLH